MWFCRFWRWRLGAAGPSWSPFATVPNSPPGDILSKKKPRAAEAAGVCPLTKPARVGDVDRRPPCDRQCRRWVREPAERASGRAFAPGGPDNGPVSVDMHIAGVCFNACFRQGRAHAWSSARRGVLQIHQQATRVFQRFLDPDEEGHRTFAVDDAVVVRKRQIHHGADHYFSANHDGPVLDLVHAEDA